MDAILDLEDVVVEERLHGEPEFGNICERYDAFADYLRVLNRPLTELERRAFLYLLDMTDSDKYPGWRHYDECECADVLPRIVQSLSPDPIDCVIASKNLDGIVGKNGRGHKALPPAHQGIVLKSKIKCEHARELQSLARELFGGLTQVMTELRARAQHIGCDEGEVVATVLPDLSSLCPKVALKKQRVAAPRASSPRGILQSILKDWMTVDQLAFAAKMSQKKVRAILGEMGPVLRVRGEEFKLKEA